MIHKVKYTGFSAGGSVAVFEPEGYCPEAHTPSPIFVSELVSKGPVPADWKIIPKFRRVFGKNIVDFSTGDADLYGTGEVRGKLRRNNDHQYFWNTENPTGFLYKGKKLYESHPWVLGLRPDGTAFGLIADTTWETELDTFRGVHFISRGPSFRVVVIEGKDPGELMRSLAALSGRMELPPLWALGYQQCRYSYFPQERAAEIADTMRSRRIPCDVLWMDIHYMDSFKIFTFNPDGFATPEALNNHLHRNNFKAVYMIDPGVKAEKGYFVDDEGREGGYFVHNADGSLYHGNVWPGDCHFPDFTNPGTCSWWAGLYKDFMAKGVDGVWNDMNEPSVFVAFGGTMAKEALHKGGVKDPSGLRFPPATHSRYHNIYGYLMARATREGVLAANPDRRPFVLSRSNFLGGQRYAAMWTGDNYSDYSQMKESVPMCLNISLSGQPFNGPDIGGFLRDCTPSLLRHWTAVGVYFPFVRNHAMKGTADQEPWAFDSLTEDVCRTAIERRYRLLPYYYTLFREASVSGIPVMRPVFWADFTDKDLRTEQQAFLVGSDLLVIPRWCHKPSLPKGDWKLFSLEDGDDGHQAYLALRSGAVLPLGEVIQSTVDYEPDSVTLLLDPDAEGKAEGSLYVDDTDGFAYKNGEYALYRFEARVKDGGIQVKATRTEGQRHRPLRMRIALIRGGKLCFSEWFEGTEARIDLLPEAVCLKDATLQFVSLKDNSISKGYTRLELIIQTLTHKI